MSDQIEPEIAEVFEPLLQPARYKGAWGGRGSGKSWFFAGEAVEALLDGKSVLCVREVQHSLADSVKKLIEARIESYGVSDYFEITDKEIRCISGGVCIFRGMQNHTAASIKSLEGFDVAWVEEAQTISQHSLDLLTPTIRAAGSELWFSWNPVSEKDPVDLLLRKNPPDEAIVIHANYDQNPWFPAELRADMERDKEREPEKYYHVWEGQYRSRSEARIFHNVRQGVMDPPDDVQWFYGVDFGFAQDPTAALRFCVMGDVLYIDHEVYAVGVATERLPAMLARIPGIMQWPSRGDSARPDTIDYLRRNGLPKLRGAKKGKGSIEDGITFLQSLDIVVHPRCANAWDEFCNYAYQVDKQTGEILPKPEDANNHLIDALRYAAERLHRKGKRLKQVAPEESDILERPPDYRSARESANSWKVA